jgi:predicted CXXCH cytochrome family protein
LTLPATADAQDRAAIYKERCASCHDAADSRAPKLEALKGMTGEAMATATLQVYQGVLAD